MPITVEPPGPYPVAVGPGQVIQLHTDFIGPIQTGSTWEVGIFPTSSTETPIVRETYLANTNQERVGPMMLPQTIHSIPTVAVPAGTQVFVTLDLKDPNGLVIDAGTTTLPWEPQTGLGLQQQQSQSVSTGGGLTAQQAQQLTDIHVSAVINQLVNAITLVPVTSGPTFDPVITDLPDLIFGVITRIETIPDGLAPSTPDQQYWVPTLATVRVFRGNDLWIRAPIHTPTKITNLHSEALLMGLAAITVGNWILDMRLLVDWHEGVAGEVFLMRFP